MTITAKLADGRVLEFPDGTDPQVIQATVKKMIGASQPQAQPPTAQEAVGLDPLSFARKVQGFSAIEAASSQSPSFVDQVVGGVEGALTLGTSLIAEPIAGLAGIAAAANPFADPGAGAQMVEQVRNFLTINPQTEQGKKALTDLGEFAEPVISKLTQLKAFLGDDAFEATGSPALAALAATLPDAALELIGAGTGRRAALKAGQAPAISQAKSAAITDVTDVEKATGIRQLTSDVLPPKTRVGSFLQQQGELIEGGQRVAQQAERVKAIDTLLTKFDVTDGARFESDIVEGVKNSINAKKAAAGELFEQSTRQLDNLGSVPITKTKQFAQKVLDTEIKKGSLGNVELVKEMQDFIDAPNDLTFESIKSVRSAVGNKLQQAKIGAPVQGSSDVGMLSQVYKKLSQDMESFANSADPVLSKKWKEADKVFSDFAIGANKSGVKSLIKRGDATPEVVDQLLFSNKNSDLEFLASNLDPTGKQAAKQRILQRMLQKSSPDGIEINPNRFQTQATKHRNQIFKFFDPEERKAIAVLRNTLEQTRRAQDAAVTTATGQQLVPLFAITNPQVLIPGVAQAIIERPTLRNLLIKRNAAKTAKSRFAIDQQLQSEIDRLGLVGAASVGAAEQTLQNTTENQ